MIGHVLAAAKNALCVEYGICGLASEPVDITIELVNNPRSSSRGSSAINEVNDRLKLASGVSDRVWAQSQTRLLPRVA
ncbi:MAG: hypothetical protein EOP66_01180 [Sphingomonas sp.]|nr:MAG: hypothetical protein EOP66_01180 [Sphingomonas sp.]